MKKIINEYWDVFRANLYDSRRGQDLRSLQIALLLMTLFSLVMSVMNCFRGDYPMLIATSVLCVIFMSTYFLIRIERKQNIILSLCVLEVMVVFTFFVFSKGNEGFAVLWTLLAPMFLMLTVGVRAGTVVGVYFQLLYIVLFWTPLRSLVEDVYTSIFMNRFPLLYLCMMVVTIAGMLIKKKHQLYINGYQKNLETAVQDERDRAMQITFQTIATISRLVDAKDQDTDEHSIRVAQYACMIAEEMGWEQKAVDDLYYAALLHDIGKVGIRDEILKKSESLDDDEFQMMKRHTTIGATVLSEMGFLKGASEGALYHHEKFDGSGYPFGLKGEAIPMVARIICLADSFDAMNTKRAYKDKYEEEYILDEIRSGRGRHFDPDVVDAFLRCLESHTIVMTKKKHG